MNQEEIKKIYAQAGAIITDDHFVYAKKADGWFHGGDYVNKDAIYPFPRFVSPLCKDIADHFWRNDIDVVVGPTVGGVSLSQWTAYWLAPFPYQKEVLAVYADEEDVLMPVEISSEKLRELGSDFMLPASGTVQVKLVESGGIEKIIYMAKVGTHRVLRRGYDKVVKGRRCLITEDVLNTGATVKKTIEAIHLADGIVLGVGALANRSGGKVTAETLGAPELFSLLDLDMKMFKEEECPICKEKGPKSVRTDLGKGKEFLVRTGNL